MLEPLALPDYAGSLLRGQFGAALRAVACMTRQPTCTACPLLQTCPYSRLFEAPPPPKGQHTLQDFSQIPNPYIIEPPAPGARVLAAGEALVFHLVLIGHAIEQLALIVFALQRALAQGLTRQRVPLELTQVDLLDVQGHAQPIWTLQHPTLVAHNATLFYPARPQAPESDTKTIAGQVRFQGTRGIKSTEITLRISTPMRLQLQGKPLGETQLNPRALIAALARRCALLMEFHAGQSGWGEAARRITQISETLTDTRELEWFDWTRYSSRQKQEMTLGGVVGSWTLNGSADNLADIEPWLWLGQWLHAGKNATMGLGGYTLAHDQPQQS